MSSAYARLDAVLMPWARERAVTVDTMFREEEARIIWLGKLGQDRVQIGATLPDDGGEASAFAFLVRAMPAPGQEKTETAEFRGPPGELAALLDRALDQGVAWLGRTRAEAGATQDSGTEFEGLW